MAETWNHRGPGAVVKSVQREPRLTEIESSVPEGRGLEVYAPTISKVISRQHKLMTYKSYACHFLDWHSALIG